jgi:hypothetical protein
MGDLAHYREKDVVADVGIIVMITPYPDGTYGLVVHDPTGYPTYVTVSAEFMATYNPQVGWYYLKNIYDDFEYCLSAADFTAEYFEAGEYPGGYLPKVR